MVHLKKEITLVAPSSFNVLIQGESGSGKELVAHDIHQQSLRNTAPIIYVNCAALPDNLIESELFGHVKGSFTGANKDRAGKFEAANGGTIFLDEIGDMSLSAQAKVLRALQESKISRVGSDKDIKVDVRVIAATNKNLKTYELDDRDWYIIAAQCEELFGIKGLAAKYKKELKRLARGGVPVDATKGKGPVSEPRMVSPKN